MELDIYNHLVWRCRLRQYQPFNSINALPVHSSDMYIARGVTACPIHYGHVQVLKIMTYKCGVSFLVAYMISSRSALLTKSCCPWCHSVGLRVLLVRSCKTNPIRECSCHCLIAAALVLAAHTHRPRMRTMVSVYHQAQNLCIRCQRSNSQCDNGLPE